MQSQLLARIHLKSALWAALVCASVTAARAQAPENPPPVPARPPSAPAPSTADLEKRVRDLEKYIRQLESERVPGASVTVPAAGSPPLDAAALRKIVADLVQEQEEAKKKAADQKAPKDEGLGVEAKEPAPGPIKPAGDAKPVEWEVGKNVKMEGTWRNGLLWFETADKAFTFNCGAVVQFDMGWYGAAKSTVGSIGTLNNLINPFDTLQDGMDFRRARLRMSGTAFEQIEYFAQFDLANSLDLRQRTLGIPNPAGVTTPNQTNFDPADAVLFNEVYIGLTQLPVIGNVRVGRHRESLNFVTATSDNYQIWMERGLMFEGFNSLYNFSNGITVFRTYFDERAYTLLGFFEQNNNNNRAFSSVGDGNYAYDGRITCLPIWDESDQLWVHLGADYSYRNLYQNYTRYRGRPDLRIGSAFQVPNIIDSGNIFSRDAQQIANLEFAMAWGRWTAAAEASCSWIPNAATGGLPNPNGTLPPGVVRRGTYFSQGAYAELLCFLTPDHRPYRKERPGYDRVVPNSRFFCLKDECGKLISSRGAWEVGVRYDYLDLTDSAINGGIAHGVTCCLNWYLTANCRVQADYIWMYRLFAPDALSQGRTDGSLNGFGIRFNCDY